MSFEALLLLAVGLAMDASAVAICKGACYREVDMGMNLKLAVSFGLFQALMPLLGYLVGAQFVDYIHAVDHWVVLVLLAGLGLKMIWDALHSDDELVCTPLTFKELMLLSVATSIDALAAGLALAMLKVNIWSAAATIGVVTAVLTFLGALLGCKAGYKFKGKAQVLGGVVLCLIGIKVLIDHLKDTVS